MSAQWGVAAAVGRLSVCGSTARPTFTQAQHMASASAASSIIACNVYVSEGHDHDIIEGLKEVPQQFPKTTLAYSFTDKPYNRSSFTIVSVHVEELAKCVARLSLEAARRVSLQGHAATHPRLGVVDHLVCQYLPQDADGAAAAARTARGAAALVAEGIPGLPVVLYGEACGERRRLQDIRRACGYFKGAAQGEWAGFGGMHVAVRADFGPSSMHATLGMCTIGAVPLVTNYNIPVAGLDMRAAKQVAREVSERGGGLPHVEAMALPHGEELEVACNLLRADRTPPSVVLARCQELARAHGGDTGQPYIIGMTGADLKSLVQAQDV